MAKQSRINTGKPSTYHQFYKAAGPSQTGAKAPGGETVADLSFQAKIDVPKSTCQNRRENGRP